MKVISGSLKGRNIEGFDIEGTRPTMDRVKESIFGTIQFSIRDSIVLDLFAGSGNLGIEAISNGANKCYFIDNNRVAINTINKNIKTFNIEDFSIVIKSDYMDALNSLKNTKFDIVFLDPPYKDNYIDTSINYLLDNNMLNEKALIICEYNKDINKDYNLLDEVKTKKYGDKFVTIFKRK
jgi:16S rRNA (guanine(966)-N(2))-methyltransferase RsmD